MKSPNCSRSAAVWIVLVLAAPLADTARAPQPPIVASAGEAARMRGLQHAYNLDYAEALAAFDEAIAIDPEDATAHRLAAATVSTRILHEQGAIAVEDYLGQGRAAGPRRAPRAELAAAFQRYIDRAVAIGEQPVRRHPKSADGPFQLGAAHALRASHIATVEGRLLGSVGAARQAYSEHERSLALDPTRADAALVVGLYRYTVANLPLHRRLMAKLAGFDSDRKGGV